MRAAFAHWVKELQNKICSELEHADGQARFIEDKWERAEGGGGITRVIKEGAVFEKGGVNISEVHGLLSPAIAEQLKIKGHSFYACGISMVIHPQSPMIPTVHANYRYFEVYDAEKNILDGWFGGGADLTPYYLFEADARHFHLQHKMSCDKLGQGLYPIFKKQCDNYFVNTHRNNERRGIGGIFYDHMRPGDFNAEQLFNFALSNGEAFISAYLPIVEQRKAMPYTEAQKHWQLIRRGRYVEFNLLHDRGTIFGLKSNGRTESILMTLPPAVRFEYDHHPAPGSDEEKLQAILLHPIDWI
jgi:coproporphyrinogen III oxidase